MPLFSSRKRNAKRKTRKSLRLAPSIEGLEDRRMLTAASLVDGTLTVIGSANNDAIRLISSNDYQSFRVTINNTVDQTFNRSDVDEIVVYAGAGHDTVTNTLVDPTTIFGQGGNDYIQGSYVNDALWGGDGNDTIVGRNGNDRIYGGNGDDTLHGSNGNNVIYGYHGNDRIYGGHGDDRIYGQGGNDAIYGHNGDDMIHGGDGHDTLSGQGGDDTILGLAGNDRIYGGNGDDMLQGGDGVDRINGHAGNDQILAGDGNDIVNAGSGVDFVMGGSGDDFIRGNQGNDILFGEAGVDRIFGDDGNDILNSGSDSAADYLNGGAGSDTFFTVADSGDSVSDRTGAEQIIAIAPPAVGGTDDLTNEQKDALKEACETLEVVDNAVKALKQGIELNIINVEGEIATLIGELSEFLGDLKEILTADVFDLDSFCDAFGGFEGVVNSLTNDGPGNVLATLFEAVGKFTPFKGTLSDLFE